MTVKRARLVALLVVCVAILTGCTPGPSPTPAQTARPTLTTQLRALQADGASLGNLATSPDATIAWVARGNQTDSLSLLPEMSELTKKTDSQVAKVAWDVADPAVIAAQVERMTTVCPDNFDIKVHAVTATAYLASVTCGKVVKPTRSYLNEQPVQPIGGTLTAQDWQHLVNEWTTLSPSRSFLGIGIDGGRVVIHLAPADGTHTCATPAVSRSLDGTNLFVNCASTYGGPTFSFAGLTGATIAAAASKAATELGATIGPGTEYRFYAADNGIEFRVKTDKGSRSQILKP